MLKKLTIISAIIFLTLAITACSSSSDEASKSDGGGAAADQSGPQSNSGKTCAKTTECHKDDECLPLGGGKGMCLGTCATLNQECPVIDSSKQRAMCSITLEDPSSGSKKNYCAYLCAYEGATYDCPNATDYTCEIGPENNPQIKYCLAK